MTKHFQDFILIQLPGSVMVLDIQITVRVIVNEIQRGLRRAPCVLDIHREYSMLLFEFQHTLTNSYIYIYIYIYMYIYIHYVWVIQYLQSHPL